MVVVAQVHAPQMTKKPKQKLKKQTMVVNAQEQMKVLVLKLMIVQLVTTNIILKIHATKYVITQKIQQKLCSFKTMNAKNVQTMKNGKVMHAKNALIQILVKFIPKMELDVNAKEKLIKLPLLNLKPLVQEILLNAMQVGSQKDHATKNVEMTNTSNLMIVQNVRMLTKEEYQKMINLAVNAQAELIPLSATLIVDVKIASMALKLSHINKNVIKRVLKLLQQHMLKTTVV